MVKGLLFLALFALPMAAVATEYGRRGNTEIVAITRTNVDLDVKTILTSQARYSIEFMHFASAPDPVGMKFLQAIRSAQLARNVKVTAMYDRHMSAFIEGRDVKNFVKAMLTDPTLECRGEVFCAHPIEKFSSGLSLSDCIHGKLIIIDRGTPFETIIYGGPGITSNSTGRIDSGFIARRIDPKLPYAGDDLYAAFQRVYVAMKKLSEKSVIRIPVQVDSKNMQIPEKLKGHFSKTPAEREELVNILNHLRTPAVATDERALKSFVFQPKSVQVLANDLYEKLVAGKFERKAFESDNHAKVISTLKDFEGTVVLSAYSVSPDNPLHEAIVDFVKRGNNVEFFTNGHEAYQAIGVARGFPAYYTYERVLKMMDEANGPGAGKITLNVLDPTKAVEMGLENYLHRKNIVYLDRRGTPLFRDDGSDNFTYSSAKYNDEILVRSEDRRFADQAYRQIQSEKNAFITLGHTELRARYRSRPFWYGCVRNMIKTNF